MKLLYGLCKRHMNGPMSHVAICHAFLVHIYSDMGKRKIRFDVRKNFERKKALRGCTVSIPLDLVIVHHGNCSAANGEREPRNLVVRLPSFAYTSTSMPNAESLQQRLSCFNMSAGWSMNRLQTPDHSTAVALYKLKISPPHAPLLSTGCTFMLTIAHDCTWTLCISNGRLVTAQQCPLLNSVAPKLCSISDVLSLLSLLDDATYCVGNADVKFIQLLNDRHKDGFRDQTGKIRICT